MKPRTGMPHGQIRQSQVITTFGPGAMVDLPDRAVLIGGLEHWTDEGRRPIYEERLTRRLREMFKVPEVKLFSPPIDPQDIHGPKTGITGWIFPQWFVAQTDDKSGDFRSRPLVHLDSLVKGKHWGRDRKNYPVIPIRFVQACVNGHISDLDWFVFAHRGATTCWQALWIDERGTSGDLADVFVRCECGVPARSLAEAAEIAKVPLGHCKGQRPWLGAASQEKCGGSSGGAEINRLLVRSASNAYFPQVFSVISIPDRDEQVRKAVDAVWEDFLQYAESVEDLQKERRKAKVHAVLEKLGDDEVWEEIRRRKSGSGAEDKTIKQVEVEMLLASPDETGVDLPSGDFYARNYPLKDPRPPLLSSVGKIVLLHRLREVMVQVGFTRFESSQADIDGELALDVERGAISLEVSWLPAVENKGEGVFVSFQKEALDRWARKPEVEARGRELFEGFKDWKKKQSATLDNFPGVKYVFLHSLSHLLITAMAVECGYSASSIRERIYAGDSGYGILLFTGTPDSEGTLGGLVQTGRHLEHYLGTAIEMGRLCSNDPVCAQHKPSGKQEERYLHGAACHGCLLIAETSCERRNEFLDRALVVPTVEGLQAEFFLEQSE